MNPIIKEGVRIFRPSEYEQLRAVVKPDKRILLDTALFTGMRYIELVEFQKHKEWLDNGKFINLPYEKASKKAKATIKERTIKLSRWGERVVNDFLSSEAEYPKRDVWNVNLVRWAEKAGLDPASVCAKSTRKTWESWLVYYYPSYQTHIAIQQGHNSITQMRHYLNMPFLDEDKKVMSTWIDGIW